MEGSRIPNNLEAIKQRVKQICNEYGLYGTAFSYDSYDCLSGSNSNRLYIIAGSTPNFGEDPPNKNIVPKELIQRIGRSEHLFFPNFWAVDITEGHEMNVYEQLIDYCKTAEFLTHVFSQHELALPEKIRYSEVDQLQEYVEASSNLSHPFEVREKCRKDIEWFFRRERSHGIRRKWLDYYRSDKFPDDKGPFTRLFGFLRRNKSKIALKQLIENNTNIKKLEMQEHEYKLFVNFMEQCYPEVSYSAGNKEIVNHGLDRPGQPPLMGTRRITSEEFAVIQKERFANEGWDCLIDVKPSYWEFRDVYFKEIDEPQIAAAYQAITLQYAQPNDLFELQNHGDLSITSFPVSEFMNFVSLAKTNGLRFYIDKIGEFAETNLEFVNIVYNTEQRNLLMNITFRMISDKVTGSHMLDYENHLPLNERISNAEKLPKKEGNLRQIITKGQEL